MNNQTPALFFKTLDLDKDGFLSRSDLNNSAKRFGWSWYEAPLLAVFDLLSILKPISESEFIASIHQIQNDPLGPYGNILLKSPHFLQPASLKGDQISATKKAGADSRNEIQKKERSVSDASAIGLIIEIQTIKRFASVKKLASFFGVHPVYKISGDGTGGYRMSKQGRIAPRQILYMTALSAIRCNPLIREIYEKHKKQGKHSRAAMGVCMHKILRILYGMLKHNQPFNPHIDLANRLRSVPMENEEPIDKTSRRLQGYDQTAPVSRRQRKRRLERERSHNVSDTMSGITAPAPLADIIADILPQL